MLGQKEFRLHSIMTGCVSCIWKNVGRNRTQIKMLKLFKKQTYKHNRKR